MDWKKREHTILYGIAIFVVITAACLFILRQSAEQHFADTASFLSSQIGSMIEDNEESKKELEVSLKQENLSKAKALAYILQSRPAIESDRDELTRVAQMLDIDEVNIFDRKGTIAYSTVPEYVGYSMHNEGQISFFLPMLEDRSLSLCQDMTPNSRDGKLIMYAMTWRDDGDSMVEVGITPEHLLAAMEVNDISHVLDGLPLESALYFVYDIAADKIVSSTDPSIFGLSNAEMPIDLTKPVSDPDTVTISGVSHMYALTKYGDHMIGICEQTDHLFRDAKVNMIVLGVLLFLVLVCIFFVVERLSEKEKEKEEAYINELKDYADQLSSYQRAILSDALISLEINLTRNELTYGVWKDDRGHERPLEEILGFGTPCEYDRYIDLWNQKFVKNYDSSVFSSGTDREHLLDTYASGSAEITFDYEAETISGRSTWLRRSICMTRNHAGDVIAFTSVKDISALVAQSKREESYVRALSTEYDSIAIVDLYENKYEDCVTLHSRVAGVVDGVIDDATRSEENFSKKLELFANYIHPDDRAQYTAATQRELILQDLAENKTHLVEFRLMTGKDTWQYYQHRFVPLMDDDGNVISLIACLRNIDEEIRREFGIRKQLEDARVAAEAASRAKSTFLFNMSHDIRTPMNAIIGFTDIAEKHIDDKGRVTESLGKVKMAGEHLLSLINDVLDMSRIESGQVKIEEEPVFLDTAKDNLYNIMAGSAEAKNIALTYTMASDITHHWFYADRLRMMRVLTNIVSNSIKYTQPGGRIDIHVEEIPCSHEDYSRYRYTIADTGIGMSEEYLTHIFEPFSREKSATKSGVVGTGLSMAITKSLVDMMGGTISIRSKLGVGTQVSLEFEHRIAGSIDPVSATSVMSCEDLNGRKILLVEDNELNREIAIEILQEEGIIVDTAEDGDIAVEKMRTANKGQYDLILMDIQMPRMNGYDATRAIRALPDPYAATIPIIAMTANAFDEDKQNAFAAGMNGHIAKPINIPQLLTTLTQTLRR